MSENRQNTRQHLSRRSFCTSLAVAPVALTVAGHAAFAEEMVRLTGEVIYRERMALPANAVLELTLQDVSLADAPAKTITTYRATIQGGSPIRFGLSYPKDKLDERYRYSLRAQILVDGQMWFTSTDHIAVVPREAQQLTIPVQRVMPSSGGEKTSALSGEWVVQRINGKASLQEVGASIVFDPETSTASGSGGCNRFSGGYVQDGAKLTFGNLASTMMACSSAAMTQEQALFTALAAVRGFSIEDSGARLLLKDDSGKGLLDLKKR